MPETDYLELFLSAKRLEGLSTDTLKCYSQTLRKMKGAIDKPVLEITVDDIRRFLSEHKEKNKCSNVTINNMRRNLSSFFGWLENEDYIRKSPIRRIANIKTPKVIRKILTGEQLEKLRYACVNTCELSILEFLLSTGVRVGELVRLDRDDIDFEQQECIVLGKGNKERIVYLGDKCRESLKKYLDNRLDKNPALFVTTVKLSRFGKATVEQLLRNLGNRAGIPSVHPHRFRRTLATTACEKGMPIEQVQQLLGHARIDTTMNYVMVNQTSVKNSHRKYIGSTQLFLVFFFVFALLAVFPTGFAFGFTPGTPFSRIISRSDTRYIPAVPMYLNGLIPLRLSLILTANWEMPSCPAMSDTVISFIYMSITANAKKNQVNSVTELQHCNGLLFGCIAVLSNSVEFLKKLLTRTSNGANLLLCYRDVTQLKRSPETPEADGNPDGAKGEFYERRTEKFGRMA
jgi:site-specific recombinase XerD